MNINETVKKYRWILLSIIVLILFGMKSNFESNLTDPQKTAVADIENKACTVDTDCPCFGVYNQTSTEVTAYGIGVAKCIDKKCNTDQCFALEPVGKWLKDNPLAWAIKNPLVTTVFVIFGLMILFWPKR